MGVTNYVSVDGDIVSEISPSGRVDFMRDALGSITGTVGPSAVLQNQYRYKPCGSLLEKSGTSPDPLFLWIGCKGYRQTLLAFCDVYVRARHYEFASGSWCSVDPLWPIQAAYVYSASAPTTHTARSARKRSGFHSKAIRFPAESDQVSARKRSGFHLKAIRI